MSKLPDYDLYGNVIRTYNGKTSLLTTSVSERRRSSLSVTAKRKKPVALTTAAAMTSRSGSVEVLQYPTVTKSYIDAGSGKPVTVTGPSGYFFGYTQSLSANPVDWDRNNGKLRAQIKDQNVNLAVSLAEYRQTASLFREAVQVAVATVRGLKRGFAFANTVATVQAATKKKVAGANLQYSYGIIPLLSDVRGAAEALAKSTFGNKLRRRVSVSSSAETYRSWQASTSLYGKYTKSERVSGSLRSTAYYTVEIGGSKLVSELGFVNLAELAWELIPYSFVVDQLINVGDILASMDALTGVSELSVCHVLRAERETFSGESKCTKVEWSRVVKTNIGLPRIEWKPSTTYWNLVNDVALLIQLRKDS